MYCGIQFPRSLCLKILLCEITVHDWLMCEITLEFLLCEITLHDWLICEITLFEFLLGDIVLHADV
jgi:hypothetical protein